MHWQSSNLLTWKIYEHESFTESLSHNSLLITALYYITILPRGIINSSWLKNPHIRLCDHHFIIHYIHLLSHIKSINWLHFLLLQWSWILKAWYKSKRGRDLRQKHCATYLTNQCWPLVCRRLHNQSSTASTCWQELVSCRILCENTKNIKSKCEGNAILGKLFHRNQTTRCFCSHKYKVMFCYHHKMPIRLLQGTV